MTRASIALSPIADSAAGAALAVAAGAAVRPLAVTAACLASLGLFVFGMAQNDFADRTKDARLGRRRPIPSGEVSPRAAALVATFAALVALGAAALASPTAFALAVSMVVFISAYNLAPAHGGSVGPFLLGSVRAQNLTLGAAALGLPSAAFTAAAVHFLYVASLSSAARMEDGEVTFSEAVLRGRLALAQLAAVAAPLLVALTVSPPAPPLALGTSLAVGVLLALWIERAFKSARAAGFSAPPTLPRLIGAALSGIFLFDAALACAAGAYAVAAALLLAFPISRALVKRFPPS